MRCHIILLAGGSGTRMRSEVPKQFIKVAGKMLISYSLDVIERSDDIDTCILVTAQRDMEYMRENVLQHENYTKIRALAAGGCERYESVLNGLKKLREMCGNMDSGDVIMIHDGARPFLTEKIIRDCREEAIRSGACAAAVPAKDTIAIADEEGFESNIPPRRSVWMIQTPQAFRAAVVFDAFEKLEGELSGGSGRENLSWVTDDAAVVAHYSGNKIRLVRGDYRNLKVTTPEDIQIAEEFLK